MQNSVLLSRICNPAAARGLQIRPNVIFHSSLFTLHFLRFFPQFIHLPESEVFYVSACLPCLTLYVSEATDELAVGLLKCRVGVQVIQSCRIDDGEYYVAQLPFRVFLVSLLQLRLEFFYLLKDLLPHVLALVPVKAHVAGLVLYAVGLYE